MLVLRFDRPRSVLPASYPAGSLAMEVRLDPRAASMRDQAADLHTSGSNTGSEHADGFSTKASRLPPVRLLAPLQFLQSHRRGSITDPKLHAAPNPPLLCPPGPNSGDLHTASLAPTFLRDLSRGSTRMATSTIATSSNSVASTKSRSKRGLKLAEDAGKHFERVIVCPRGSTPSDFEVELDSALAGVQHGRFPQTAKAHRWQETETSWR